LVWNSFPMQERCDLDLWAFFQTSKRSMKSLRQMILHVWSMRAKGPLGVKLLVGKYFEIQGQCDINHWSCDLKINKGLLLTKTNVHVMFEGQELVCFKLLLGKHFHIQGKYDLFLLSSSKHQLVSSLQCKCKVRAGEGPRYWPETVFANKHSLVRKQDNCVLTTICSIRCVKISQSIPII
jgi:hypothetical protein